MTPTFDTLSEGTGLEVLDPIETRRFTFSTPTPVAPTPADPDEFSYPVTSACTVETGALQLPYLVLTYLRDADGDIVTDLANDESVSFSRGEYVLELSAPIKLYLRVESALAVESTTDSLRIDFDGPATVGVGARSVHQSPEATITVSDDPRDAMAAVSAFGSALKTTTCERAWPTLRGHPPRIERGDELHVPDELDPPDTGVTIHVPADYEHLLPVAPLAYYFRAEVVAGGTPRLTVGGFERRFDLAEFEDEVVEFLRRVFLLDCVTRTEGYYTIDLYERDRVESAVDLDFAALYDAPLDQQLSAYLSVPRSVLSEVMPTWPRVTYVRPTAETAETLPYLVNDFSILRTPPNPEYVETAAKAETRETIGAFKRRPPYGEREKARDDSEADRDDWRGVPPVESYVQMPDADALELAWVGDGTPVRGTKILPQAFENPKPDTKADALDVTVVCNDEAMREKWDAVADIYRARDAIPFDVNVRFDATTDELRGLLSSPTDLFHYVGHIDGREFECADGLFDAATLDESNVEAFLLNVCRSHDQGVALVDAGSRGGIVSLGTVGNRAAVDLGETLAKLLHHGFTVGHELSIADEYLGMDTRYIALGDPGVTLA